MAVTEEDRKQNIKTMTLYMSVVCALICAYLFSYAGSVAEDEGIPVMSAAGKIFVYMVQGKILPVINKGFIAGTILGLLMGIVIYFLMSVDSERNYTYDLTKVAGSGGFMSKKELEEYNEKYIDPEPEDPNEPSPNMIMSDKFRRPMNSRKIIGNNNVLVVGGAGTGKSRFFIKPNVLQMNASYVITDPSGEIISAIGQTLSEHGYRIKIFNTTDMVHSNCYNPLEYIRDEAGVNMVIDCLINNTTNGKSDEDFWVKAEKLLYSACIFYLVDFCNDKSKKNFSSVLNLINASAVDENNTSVKSPLDLLFEGLPKDSLAWKNYKAFKQAAGKTLKSIIISCVTRLRPFMTPQVVNLTRRDEMELAKLGDEKTALFIITPQADKTYSFLPSMLYSQMFETLYFKGEEQKAAGHSEEMKIPVRCLMDEFANIGEVPEFPSKLSTMRKYNISATVVLQDIAQIEAMYKDDWKTLVGNCSSIIFLGSSEPNTLEYFSKMLGKGTVTTRSRGVNKGGKVGGSRNFQQTGREVMTPDELGRMDPNGSMEIVYTMNLRPVFDKKYKYENHPHYKETADYDKSKAFLYRQMAVYNNERPVNINSLLKAKAESARIRKNQMISSPEKASEFHLEGSVFEAYGQEILEKKQRREMIMCAFNKATEQVMKVYSDQIPIILMKSIHPKQMAEVLSMTAASLGKDRMILFNDLSAPGLSKTMLYGLGYEKENKNLAEIMKSDLLKEYKTREDGFVMVGIERANLERYKNEVLRKAQEMESEK